MKNLKSKEVEPTIVEAVNPKAVELERLYRSKFPTATLVKATNVFGNKFRVNVYEDVPGFVVTKTMIHSELTA